MARPISSGEVFLDEMDPLDRHLGLRRKAPSLFEDFAAGEDSARLRLEKQFRHAARLQPVGIGVHDRGYIGGIALDGDFPGQRQSRSSALPGLGEGPPVLRHLLVGELTQDGAGQDLLDKEVVLQDHLLAGLGT